MGKRLFFICICFLMLPTLTFAQSICFGSKTGKNPAVQTYEREKSAYEQIPGLANTCEELNPSGRNTKIHYRKDAHEIIGETFGLFLNLTEGLALGAFSSMNSNDDQKLFKYSLEKIGQIPDPVERISLVYKLVSKIQGDYDYKTTGGSTDDRAFFVGGLRPENILDEAKATGSAGVCRDMAAFLYWSLRQVQRWPGSKSLALGPNDFSADFIAGNVPSHDKKSAWLQHRWVRINLPNWRNGYLDFDRFDLDTTWYPNEVSFLYPRRSGISAVEQDVLYKNCLSALRCLRRENPSVGSLEPSLKTKIPSPKTGPTPPPAKGRKTLSNFRSAQ